MTPLSTFGRRWAALPYAIFDRNPLLKGGGIQFPATQVPSADVNTLDDYEEGTWTPAITFGGASVGVTYTTQTGRYTKIGRSVVLQGFMQLSSKGSSTGAAQISGVPFSPGGGIPGNVSITFYTGAVGLTGTLMGIVSGAAIALVETSATTHVNITDANAGGTFRVGFSSVYSV